ncbi:MAG TPA: glycosyltransferase family 2 protein [Flavisolibacter sp.]|nr:glycosyltransferase family 2 protein [Flavisolibacter sp.]
MPFVSVIVPNYNHALYLDKRLQSILDQTYQDYEIIILDDCSTDNSREVIERYRNHSKVTHIVFNETNSGSTFKQWRKGLELAKGEWIWIAESDDYCSPELLSKLLQLTSGRDNIVLSYCQSLEVDGDKPGRDMSWYTDKISKDYWKTDHYTAGLDEIKQYLLLANTIPNASAVIFKKDAYSSVDRKFETMKMCGDWLFYVEILRKGDLAFCAEPHNYFRIHQATTRFEGRTTKWKTVLEEEYQVISQTGKHLSPKFKAKVAQKKLQLVLSYCSLYSIDEIKRFLLKPGSYRKPIPRAYFLSIYLLRHAFGSVKKLFSR